MKLQENLELAKAKEIVTNSKIEMLESMARDSDKESNDKINEVTVAKIAEKAYEVRSMQGEIEKKEQELIEKDKKITDLEKKLTISNDLLIVKDNYIRNVDNMYAEIIRTKEDVIETYKKVSEDDDEVGKSLKRILMQTLADKELRNVKDLYKSMKCQDVQCQTEVHKDKQVEDSDVNVNKSEYSTEGKINESEKQTKFTDIVKEIVHTKSTKEIDTSTDPITMRIINLPSDMNEDEIAKIFQIDEGLGKVEMFNMNNNTLVKITIPEAREKELMRLDQTFINSRKIRVFRLEKCRLGSECRRKVCRFGHGEVLQKRYPSHKR